MNRTAAAVLIWATFLTTLTVVLWIWFPDSLSVGLLGGAAVAAWLIGVGFALSGRRRAAAGTEVRVLPDLSVGTVVVAIALAGMLFGAEFGFFLVLISAGVLAVGLACLLTELRSETRRRRRVEGG